MNIWKPFLNIEIMCLHLKSKGYKSINRILLDHNFPDRAERHDF